MTEICEICLQEQPLSQLESVPILTRSNDGKGQDWETVYKCKPFCRLEDR